MPNNKNFFIKETYLIIEKFFNNIEKTENSDKQLFICYQNAFNVATALLALLKLNKSATSDYDNKIINQINIFRSQILLPFLAEYDEEFLPFLKSDGEFKNIIIDPLEHNNIDHHKWINEIIKATKILLAKLLKIEKLSIKDHH